MTTYFTYRAKVESKKMESNRYLCRILPDMAEIKETELLPDFPNFLTSSQQAYNIGDMVWVICDDDYQIGYILGFCEPSVGTDYTSVVLKINEAEKEAGLVLSAPGDLSFTQHMDVAIDFYNRSTSQNGRIVVNGAVLLFGHDGSIYIKNPLSSMLFDKTGNIIINSKSVEQTVTGDVTEIGSKLSESYSSAERKTDGILKETSGAAIQSTAGSNRIVATGGTYDHTIIKEKRETIGTGERKRIVAGGSATTALVGDITQRAIAGSIVQEGLTVKIVGNTIEILGGILNLRVSQINGSPGTAGVIPVTGPFCSIPICPVTGLPHCAATYTAADPTIVTELLAEQLTPPEV